MKRGNLGLIAVVLLLILPFVSAQSGYFTVKSTAIDNKIMINEEARFEVAIENHLGFDESFRIYYTDIEWGFSTEPTTSTTVKISDGSSKTVAVVLSPLYVGYGSHGVTLSIKSVSTGKLVRHPVLVNIISLGTWSPGKPIAVGTEVDMPREINPKERLKIRISLENRYAINVSDLNVKVQSSFFNAEQIIDLKPLEEKTVEFNIDLDPKTPPKKDVVLIRLTSEDQTFKEVEKEVEVIAYASLIEKEVYFVKKFLKTDREISVTNEGNAKVEEDVKREAPPFSKLYVFSKPRAKVKFEDSKSYLAWEVSLEPGETEIIKVSESYRPMLAIILLAALIVLGYFIFRSPVIIKKQATKIKLEEGGLSQIKTLLYVKNRSNSKVKNVKVLDRVPSLADVVKTFKIGSLQPVKILKHEKKGSVIKWYIEELEPYEERIIVYHIRARLTILGLFELPPALPKFRDKKGNARFVSSNKVTVRV